MQRKTGGRTPGQQGPSVEHDIIALDLMIVADSETADMTRPDVTVMRDVSTSAILDVFVDIRPRERLARK